MRQARAVALIALSLGAAHLLAAVLAPVPARALFGLFGDAAPKPDSKAVVYVFSVETGDDGDARQGLLDASLLQRLRDQPPETSDGLARRAALDFKRLYDALWGMGFYNGAVRLEVDGAALPADGAASESLTRALDARRGHSVAKVVARIALGPQFRLRTLRALTPEGEPLLGIPARTLELKPGDPGRAGDLREALARIVDFYRAQSRPLTKGVDVRATILHPEALMDVDFIIAPGAIAPIGEIAIDGAPGIAPQVLRSFVYVEPGDSYSPEAMADLRKGLLKLPALASARIKESDHLDAQGALPIFVEVSERPKRVIGASARFSSVDGPHLRAYWEHRNLFGGAEDFRIEGDLFSPPRADGRKNRGITNLKWSDLGGRLRLAYVKPSIFGGRADLVASAMAERDRTGGDRYGGYEVRRAEASVGLRYRFSSDFNIQGSLKYEDGRTRDDLGVVRYRMAGAPFSLTYDSTDNPLDATRGFKALASATPYYGFGDAASFLETRGSLSAYRAIDERERFVLAGRIGGGIIAGAPIGAIPAVHRFFAGGPATVRGYRLRSIGPETLAGRVVGGRAMIEGSLEARIKITQTIGLVPFIDAGGAFADSALLRQDKIRVAAGLGLRYYTPIGPLRFDAAFPVNKRAGDRKAAFYISIGQAF